MVSYRLDNMAITIDKQGASSFRKASFPVRFGTYSEIKTFEYEFQFNLKGEIKFIRGLNVDWPHPSESLKRTDGNDWVFYSVGTVTGLKGVREWLGEYYLPCLPYASNSLVEFNPFSDATILKAFAAWSQLYAGLYGIANRPAPAEVKAFTDLILHNHENALYEKSQKLHTIIGGRLSVLPPDTRHVDYEVIPLIIADGCLYHCDFCSVKSDQRFKPRSKRNILEQISQLKTFYGPNLQNFKALFLGNHDALGAGNERIILAATEAVKVFGLGHAHLNKNPLLFLFGSVDAFLKNVDELLAELNASPFYTYINIGLESVDGPTLQKINKPLKVSRIHDAFQKMLVVNRDYGNIEITANFLLGEQLSPQHYGSITELLQSVPDSLCGKGAIYLSPLMDSRKRPGLLQPFYKIKNASRLPVFIYLIQRL
ncbi:radical SAM protein [Thermodesulfobacteriota bacterium]